MSKSVTFEGNTFSAEPGESVLDVLLRNQQSVSYSCKAGICQTCIMQAQSGTIPSEATEPLTNQQRGAGQFLACQCTITDEVAIGPPAANWHEARVTSVERLSQQVCRMRVENPGFSYKAGQYLQVRRADGLERTYSIASVPDASHLELHVGRVTNGAFSNWVHDELKSGETVSLSDPNGLCYYRPEEKDAPLLLIGTGTGLAPLIGIAQSALNNDHKAPIHLLHGAGTHDRLYLQEDLAALAETYENFQYLPCTKRGPAIPGHHQGDLESGLKSQLTSTAGFQVFLCGNPHMVEQMKTAVFLTGADFQNIQCDAFTIRNPL